jgi:hypothetical protein
MSKDSTNNAQRDSVAVQRFVRGDLVEVEYADGSRRGGGVLEWDESGHYKVFVPAEDICRWVPHYAVSNYSANND